MADADVKPAQQTISITIKEADGQSLTFKVKRSIKFEKIFKAFLDKKGAAPGSFKFKFEGTVLENGDTPEDAGVDEGDQIDALIEQTGGAR